MKLVAPLWAANPHFDTLVKALGAEEGQLRVVGGAVRDTLLGLAVEDVDLATPLLPQEVTRRAEALGAKVIPTGIAHGTVTIIYRDHHYEVTTLRRDVSTDGRRATVAFSEDWREDASRRDFTINALYADPLSHEVDDYFGGLEDIAARRVRFIGSPTARIAEDHLRILRYFRFHARFGKGAPDAAAYEAVCAEANSLMALSRERVADELLKLLALPDPVPTLALMDAGAIWRAVIPEADEGSVARVALLVANEAASGTPADALRRLIAFLPREADSAAAIASRLKLSNVVRKRIAAVRRGGSDALALGPRTAAHRLGHQGALDLWLVETEGAVLDAAMKDLTDWSVPRLPIGGGAIVARGVAMGPDVARLLQEVERQWVAEGFPDAARVDAIADGVVREFKSA